MSRTIVASDGRGYGIHSYAAWEGSGTTWSTSVLVCKWGQLYSCPQDHMK